MTPVTCKISLNWSRYDFFERLQSESLFNLRDGEEERWGKGGERGREGGEGGGGEEGEVGLAGGVVGEGGEERGRQGGEWGGRRRGERGEGFVGGLLSFLGSSFAKLFLFSFLFCFLFFIFSDFLFFFTLALTLTTLSPSFLPLFSLSLLPK